MSSAILARPVIALLGLVLLPGLNTPVAQAATEHCVNSIAQFNVAWQAALNEPVVIRMATGQWDMSGSLIDPHGAHFIAINEPVRIEGGYNASCSTRSEDPGATALTGVHLTIGDSGSDASLSIDRLTLRDIQFVKILAERSLSLNRVRLDRIGQTFLGGNRITLRNSLITDGGGWNHLDSTCMVQIDTYHLDAAWIEHNTFSGNSGLSALCLSRMDLPETDHWRLSVVNNIFWGNQGDIHLRKRTSVPDIDARFSNNIIVSINFNRPLSQAMVATLMSDPQFIHASAGNYRLASASPAIHFGRPDINALNDRDFDGRSRWIGEAPDLGAFESNSGATGATLTVTNTNDSGPGSLRQALIDANALPDLNHIHFSIGSTCGPRVIALNSLLPTIAHPVVIDGYTQPGASRNSAVLGNNATICVVIDGNNQITGSYGLNVATNAAPDATVSIEGLAFGGHSIAAVQFAGGRDHRLAGVQIGGSVGAVNLLPSATGVRVGGATEGVRIGGPGPGERNVITHATGIGINVAGSGNTQPVDAVIENNYVGTLTGGDIRGNQRGIVVAGAGHTIRGNVVANSASHGIELVGSYAIDNRIHDNRIGIPAACATCVDRGNGGHGIRIANGADGNRIENNRIAFSGEDGVVVINAGLNTLRRNRFHDNAGIGIDLGDNGRDLFNGNNTQPPANAANGGQNNPAITRAVGGSGQGSATGTLTSRNGWYRIDFHAAPQCQLVFVGAAPMGFWGQGEDWLGSTVVQISNGSAGNDGNVTFQGVLAGLSGGYFDSTRQIMATATRLSGNPNLPLLPARHLGTSEFGRCRIYEVSDVIFADGFETP